MFPDITWQYFLKSELSLGLQVIKVILLNLKKSLYNSYFEIKQEFSEGMIFLFFKFLLLVNKYFLNSFFWEIKEPYIVNQPEAGLEGIFWKLLMKNSITAVKKLGIFDLC